VPFHSQKRPKRLLSGLGLCGICGGGWVVMGRDRWGCAGYRDGRGCTNNRTLTNREYERRVMAGLGGVMLDPEAVALYLAEYRKRFEENAAAARADRRRLRKAVEEAETRIGRFVAAIGAGAEIAELRDALIQAREQRDAATAELAALEAETNVVAMHPKVAERYKAEFADLQRALQARPTEQPIAAATIRSLVEVIRVWPSEQGRGTRIEIAGRMASILALATGQKTETCTLKVVPDVRHGHERTFLRAKV
jgi:site-specific DNA recombinase